MTDYGLGLKKKVIILGVVSVLFFMVVSLLVATVVGFQQIQGVLTLVREGPTAMVVQAKERLLEPEALRIIGQTLSCVEAVGGPSSQTVLSGAASQIPNEDIRMKIQELQGNLEAQRGGLMDACLAPFFPAGG